MKDCNCLLYCCGLAAKRLSSLLAGIALAVALVSAAPVVLTSSATAFADEPSSATQLAPGTTISVMGDSISTYDGWSNKYPITDEDCTNRYGEPYYGLPGSDCHNEELLVSDTWWHQAATEMGAEILVSNAGNSTGLFFTTDRYGAEWELYLKEMLAWKTRPYHLGTADQDPDIIALYIGSNEAGGDKSKYGSIEDVDFATLIVENADGTYTYAEPATVAEAYCILLHKTSVTYPDAEIYCFTVVPNSGGYLSTCNKRLESVIPLNEMVRDVAAYHGLTVVDLYAAFGLDADGDGKATQEEWDLFKTYFNGDPHPNAAGFDVITECFTATVLANSKFVATEDAGDTETSTEVRTPMLELAVPLTTEEGEATASAFGAAEGTAEVTGDQKESDEDSVYDYTITTVVGQGVVTVATRSIECVNTAGKLSGSLTYVNNTTEAAGDNGLVAKKYVGEVAVPEQPEISDGYEYEYIGSDKLSRYWAAMLIADESVMPEGEEPIYVSEDGETKLYSMYTRSALEARNFTVPRLYLGFDDPIEGSWPAQYDSVQQFTLVDKAGNTVTTYCADLMATAMKGYEYNVCDIETGTYYAEEDAAMIRAVAFNGYWGTESGFGSLSAMRDMMRASGEFTEDEIALLNDGMALTATQYAIWTYSNSLHKRVFVNAYYATTTSMYKAVQADQDHVDLLFKLYRYLISLPPVTIGECTTANSIIESGSFLEGASLFVTGKPADLPANQDEDFANDVYTVDLSIELKHELEEGNGDDLSLVVTKGDELVVDGRLAGELAEGQQQLSVENGEVVISGLTLQEGAIDDLGIAIVGTQNLDKGVYLFPSEVRDGVASQTMVGVAEGARTVNALVNVDFEFAVEDEVVSVERVWRVEAEEVADELIDFAAPSEDEAAADSAAPVEDEVAADSAAPVEDEVAANFAVSSRGTEVVVEDQDAEASDAEADAEPAVEETAESSDADESAEKADNGVSASSWNLLTSLRSLIASIASYFR